MDRRHFLKNLSILLAATQLPTRLLDGVVVPAKTIVLQEYKFVSYSLGFSISQEIIDDDMYGSSFTQELARDTARIIDARLCNLYEEDTT